MEILYQDIMRTLNQYLLPLFRVLGVFMLAPGLGSRLWPMRLRVMAAMILTVPIAFHLPLSPVFHQFSVALLLVVAQQLMIGLVLGFLFQVVIQTVIVGAQIIAMQMGLGFAAMVDPQSGTSVPLLSQFYLVVATLLFFTIDGHLLIIGLLADSFTLLPIGTQSLAMPHWWELVLWAKIIFSASVSLSLPAVIALLLVNFAFGVMTRAAPQLNIFSVGFPITLALGLVVVVLTLDTVLPHIELLLKETTEMWLKLVTTSSGI